MLPAVKLRALGIALAALLLASSPGCGSAGDDATPAAASADSPATPGSATAEPATSAPVEPTSAKPAEKAPRPPNERPIPAIAGTSLDGRSLSTRDWIGKRYLLFLFNPEVDVAESAARALATISGLRERNNFDILGIATGAPRDTIDSFVGKYGLDFPILDDSTARIASMLRAPVPVLLALVDDEGYVIYTTGWPEKSAIGPDVVETAARRMLRLPIPPSATRPVLGTQPLAPDFSGTDLDGNAFSLSAQRGRAVLLVFFLHTCPHCHHALEFLKTALPKIPEAQRPELVGVSVVDRAYAVRERLESDGLDFFPVLMDPGGKIREAYGANAGVPDLVLIDAEGRIVQRSNGWQDDRDPALYQMWLAKVGGAPIPMLLSKTGYSGNEFCSVCHDLEGTTYAFTQHAYAFDTLVKHNADRNPECVGCHVVGWGQPHGYELERPDRELEGVGCESCHGRGGPHLSPDFVQGKDYAPRCETCHDTKHSLGFDFATFWPRISHLGHADLVNLPLDQKLARVEALGAPRKSILPSNAAFVGSEACKSCHPKEFETWSGSGHARAGATLIEKHEAGNAECLACHTTGYGRPGGFPKGVAVGHDSDLGRVGCESCHGPGGDHVGEDARRTGTIVSLGDKCDSCVILQICGGCHDEANDPGFEFEVIDKIERQRHGTIQPAASKTGSTASALPHGPGRARRDAGDLPHTAVLGVLERAFAGEPAG
jgi:peroxiredoxin